MVASGTPPLTYQWQRFQGANWTNVGGQQRQLHRWSIRSSPTTARASACNVTNAGGNVFSNEAVLTVTTNQAPVATITLPSAGLLYAGGQTIAFAGTGTDPEDGPRPASAFTWRVDFHHDTHSHPFLPATSGLTSGTFVIPTTGETAANVWYRVLLTVTDSAGRTHTVQRDVFPRVVRPHAGARSPAGLQLRLDGQPVTTPHAFDSVVGVVRTIDAADQTVAARQLRLRRVVGWRRARAVDRTPPVDTTYTARFVTVAAAGPPAPPTGAGDDRQRPLGAGVVEPRRRAPWATGSRRARRPGLANLFNGDVGDVDRSQAVVPPGTYFVRVRAVNLHRGRARRRRRPASPSASAATCVTPPPAPTELHRADRRPARRAVVVGVARRHRLHPRGRQRRPGLANLVSGGVGNVTTFTATAPAGTYYTRLRAVNDCGVERARRSRCPSRWAAAPEAVVPGGLTVTKSGGAAYLQLAAAARRDRLPDAGRDGARAPAISPTSMSARPRRSAVNLAGVPPGTLLRAGRGGERVRRGRAVERGGGQRSVRAR